MITADDFAQETWTFFKNVSILRFYGTKYFENEINQYNGACLRSFLNFDSFTSTVNIFWIQHSGVAELSTRVILGIYSNTDPMNRKLLLMEYLKVTKLSKNSL